MRASSARWELGSHFDEGSVVRDGRGLDLPTGLVVESGRQALSLLSAHLRGEGFERIIFPTHHCESMIDPFLQDGWQITWALVSKPWTMVPPTRAVSDPSRTLIYSLSFFGVPESVEWLTWVTSQRAAGARVVSDETHRVGGVWMKAADHYVASFRKMLPVPDGAVLTGMDGQLSEPGEQGKVRWEAMMLKRRQLATGEPRTYLDAFASAESITERDVRPASASAQTHELLSALNVEELRRRRRANADALNAALEDSRFIVTTLAADVPSHVVLEGPGSENLRKHLIARDVFAPVHWPRSQVEVPDGWRTDILSIPVDHRYTTKDMERVAEIIHEFELGS